MLCRLGLVSCISSSKSLCLQHQLGLCYTNEEEKEEEDISLKTYLDNVLFKPTHTKKNIMVNSTARSNSTAVMSTL